MANKRQEDATTELYKAVQEYVLSYRGSLMVVGGVQIIKWPTDGTFNFTVGIKCTGKEPMFPKRKRKP